MKQNYFWNPGCWNVQNKGIGDLALHVDGLKLAHGSFWYRPTVEKQMTVFLQRQQILPLTSSPMTDSSPNNQQPHPFHIRDISFDIWISSHDSVCSSIILISSLCDSSFSSLSFIHVPMKTSSKYFREQDESSIMIKLASCLQWNAAVFDNIPTS